MSGSSISVRDTGDPAMGELVDRVGKGLLKLEADGNKVLITGGTGLVGSAILSTVLDLTNSQACANSFKFLSSKDGDLRDPIVVRKIFDEFQPTHVIHLAAMVGGLFHNMANNLDFYRSNMLMNDNVLQTSCEKGVKKVVSCLSTCIFPDKTVYPIDESMIHLGPPHGSNYGYSYAKRMIDVQNRGIFEKYGLKYTSVIPCNVYGPNDNYHLQKSHVIPGLIHKFYLAKERKEQAAVMGSGTPLRQFIHSRDLAFLMLWVLLEYDEVDPIVLSVDENDEVSIKDVAQMISKSIGLEKPLAFDTSAADGQFKKTASNAKLRTYLPCYKFLPIENGISHAVEWFIANYETARK